MTSEEQVIGSLLLDNKGIEQIATTLEPQMFSDPVCGTLYYEFLKGYATKKPVNPFTIADAYKDRPEVMMCLNYCAENVIISTGLKEAAELVVNQYRVRKLTNCLNKVKPNADNVDEVIHDLKLKLDELELNTTFDGQKLSELAHEFRNDYFKDKERIRFGLDKLDGFIGSLDRGDITVIGARPSVGKSAFAAQLGTKLTAQGYKVGMFVLEMSKKQMYERFISQASKIQMERVRQATGFLNDEEQKWNIGNDRLEETGDIVIFQRARTADEIRLITKNYGFDLIIVDYLQLLSAKDTYRGNKVQEVSELSAEFKGIAMDLGCHVILLSQLNRKTEDKARPTMAELRDSGAIEQDASNILLMWNLKTDGEKGLAVEKCRQGKRGGIVLEFDGDLMTFKETDKDLKKEEQWETTKKSPWQTTSSSAACGKS